MDRQFPYRKNPTSLAVQHTIRLVLHPWRSATRHKARPRTFRPLDKWSTNKVRLLQICWWHVHLLYWIRLEAPNLQEAADAAYLWTIQNDMKINKCKTKELVTDFSKTRTHFPTIRIDGTDTQRVTEAKILGITHRIQHSTATHSCHLDFVMAATAIHDLHVPASK